MLGMDRMVIKADKDTYLVLLSKCQTPQGVWDCRGGLDRRHPGGRTQYGIQSALGLLVSIMDSPTLLFCGLQLGWEHRDTPKALAHASVPDLTCSVGFNKYYWTPPMGKALASCWGSRNGWGSHHSSVWTIRDIQDTVALEGMEGFTTCEQFCGNWTMWGLHSSIV